MQIFLLKKRLLKIEKQHIQHFYLIFLYVLTKTKNITHDII